MENKKMTTNQTTKNPPNKYGNRPLCFPCVFQQTLCTYPCLKV